MSEKLVFFGASRQVMARAEEKNHRGTEVTEKGQDLYLRALCASVVQKS